jgi:hypothetical protein
MFFGGGLNWLWERGRCQSASKTCYRLEYLSAS